MVARLTRATTAATVDGGPSTCPIKWTHPAADGWLDPICRRAAWSVVGRRRSDGCGSAEHVTVPVKVRACHKRGRSVVTNEIPELFASGSEAMALGAWQCAPSVVVRPPRVRSSTILRCGRDRRDERRRVSRASGGRGGWRRRARRKWGAGAHNARRGSAFTWRARVI